MVLAIEAEVTMTDRTRTPATRWYPTDCADHYIAGYKAGARAPLDVERLYDALAHWYDGADGGESFRLVPMSSDGGVMPTGDLHPFAAAIAREYAKDPQP